MNSSFALALTAWVIATAAVVYVSRRQAQSHIGLGVVYLVQMGLLHFFGALIYADGKYRHFDPNKVLDGFELSTLGVCMFAAGFLFTGMLVRVPDSGGVRFFPVRRDHLKLLAAGLAFWFVIVPAVQGIPTVNAIAAGLSQLVVLGFMLANWSAQSSGNPKAKRLWLLAPLVMPVLTLILSGFLGYGVTVLIEVLVFVFVFFRKSSRYLLLLPLLVYIGLSLYLTYMDDRRAYRDAAWAGQAGLGERVDMLESMFSDFKWFDFSDHNQRRWIDIRLNQNNLVGQAMTYLGQGRVEPAHGETIVAAFVALVPRAIWPDKPAVGGGGDLVSTYTGIRFAEGTSVGAGQVLEFYANFLTAGVVVGFFLLGAAIRLFELRAASALSAGDTKGFIVWCLPGLGFMQAGGNFVEVVTTVAVGFVAAYLALKFFSLDRVRAVGHAVAQARFR